MAILFLVPYVLLFRFVGAFPAEDANAKDVLPHVYFTRMLCSPGPARNGTAGKAGDEPSQSRVPERNGDSNDAPPEIRLLKGTIAIPKRIFRDSRSVYFSRRTDRIVALDRIDWDDANQLWMLAMQNVVPMTTVNSFLWRARNYYPPCDVPILDRGVTEGYWAAKGTSVLHHWVHLYDGSLRWTHAQYGYLVPTVASRLLEWSSALGPTRFVQVAWVLFALCGMAYIGLFFWLFRKYPYVALLALFFKVAVFFRLGDFALLLAPGYHWFRELVVLTGGVLLYSFWGMPGPGYGLQRKRAWVVGIGILGLCYLTDPLFCMIAVTCAVLAGVRVNASGIAEYARTRKQTFVWVVGALVVVCGVLMVLQASNMEYIADKLLHHNEGLFSWNPTYVAIVSAICLMAAGWLVLYCRTRGRLISSYFALITLISALYYAITPDRFHFLKFIGYSVPWFASVGVFMGDHWARREGAWWGKCRVWFRRMAVSGMGLLSVVAVSALLLPPHD
ncbi:MAG: hypothetical protein WCB49_05830, partial [Gammaproteobacteria bacterium]